MDEFIAWLWDLDYWHWWVLAVLMITIEVLVPSTFLLWPGLSAVAVGGILLVVPDFDWRLQMLAFAVLAVATSVGWQVWLRQHPTDTDQPLLNMRGASYVGRRVRLDRDLTDGRGRLRIDDSSWSAVSADGDTIRAGETVVVTGYRSATLEVRRAVPANEAETGGDGRGRGGDPV
jgi:membrane protein implicated in regulation of membrane protease activity